MALFFAAMLSVIMAFGTNAQRPKTLPMTTEEVLDAEQILFDLGYWTGPVDGKFDGSTRHALVAFQKVERRRLTGQLTREELTALRSAARPAPREGGYAHVEIDITRQVLFVVDTTGMVTKVLPVSTGSGAVYTDEGRKHLAHTPRGNFTVYRKINGWRRSTLGLLYYPNYIDRGVAIHGSPSVPMKPASHGCIRIPMYASVEFSSMTPEGTIVLVYDDE